MTDLLRRQYEAYPYPLRDPQEEKTRLLEGYPSHLVEVNHYVFGGRRDFRRPFRALVAGGGTGDGAIMLGQQLADRGGPAEVVYLDLSAASRRVAEARAEVRGLTNIRFVTGSLLDLPALGLGAFDYVDCCGVLHHLPDPAAGLTRLAEALAPGGGLGIMLYGALGRTGVYDVQGVLRRLAPLEEPPEKRVDIAKRLLKQLPPTNRLVRNPLITDHQHGGDNALYDLLLHSQDVAYTVPEMAALAEAAGLAIVGLIEPWRYDPDTYVNDGLLRRRLAGLGWLERAALAELMVGNIKKHTAYLVPRERAATAVARSDDPAAVPLLRDAASEKLARGMTPAGEITVSIDGFRTVMRVPRLAGPMLARVDGRRSLGTIHRELAAGPAPGLDWSTFLADFQQVFRVFNGINSLFLTVPDDPDTAGGTGAS
ncbi:MAG: class I SAM-dependent methyltransferase [Dongiaceae bacterium]